MTAKTINCKKQNLNKGKIHYKVEFDKNGLPTSYLYQVEFSLRNDYRYNPIWRIFNTYPIFYIWHYQLKYDSLQQLLQVTETTKRTNSKYVFIEDLVFEYDSMGNVMSQAIQQRNCLFPEILFGRSKYSKNKSNDTLLTIIHTRDFSPTDTIRIPQGKLIEFKIFSFGDSLETFNRNIPYDRNTTLYSAEFINSEVTRNAEGLRIKKQQKLVLKEFTTMKTNNCIVYQYEYY